MKKFWLLFSLLFVSIFLSGCSSSPHNTDEKIVIGLNDEFVPFEYRNDSQALEGFDIDLIDTLAKELKVDYDIETVDFETIFEGLGLDYDVIVSALSKTPEREDKYALSEPYIANGVVIVTLESNPERIPDYAGLSGKTVGVVSDTSAEELAELLHDTVGKEVSVDIFDTVGELYEALRDGKVQYILSDVGVANYYIKENPGVYVVCSNDVLTNEPLVIASSNEELNQRVNQALDNLRANGTLRELSIKWFGADWTSDIDKDVRIN